MDTSKALANVCPLCGEKNPDAFRIYFDGYIKLYRCRTCTFVAQYPGPGSYTIVEEYGDYYDLDFVKKGQEFMYPYRRRVLGDIADRVFKIVGAGKKILDVGCGDAHFLHLAEQKGLTATGVEPSKLLSEYGQGKIRGTVHNTYYSKDLFPAESFDVISFIQVVEHLVNPAELLEVAKYHLKPGGLIVIEVPSILSPHFLAWRFTGIKYFVKPPDGIIDCHVNYFTPKTMRALTQKVGFSEYKLVTGRWKVKYSGILRAMAYVLDPIFDIFGIGGILYIGRKQLAE